MKTSNKISLIAGIAAVALVGTGYAAWVFSKTATADATGNVTIIEKADEVGSLEVNPNSFSLILDQDFIGWKESEDGDALTTIELTYSGSKATDHNGDAAVAETIKFTVEFEGDALASYVTFGDYEEEIAEEDYTGEDITVEFTLPEPSWVETAYPRNEEAYDAMVEALEGATVTFTFTAEVVECTHE